uniref:Uncharacterized protein n=1 Tax=Spongospora subterranea TaxID=70186 RepID=A0A0H5R241_9EUKA|eukprot:CRZ08260.1 hypothetical protein [Spongospora subterranea]
MNNRNWQKQMEGVSKYDFIRNIALEQYFTLLQSSVNMVAASRTVAANLFPTRSEINHSRTIRKWAEHFLLHKELPKHRQGCHVKSRSLIHDEDIARECRIWLKCQTHDSVTCHSFHNGLPINYTARSDCLHLF